MNNGLIRYRGDFALLDQVRHVDVRRKGKEENGNGIRVFSSPIEAEGKGGRPAISFSYTT